MKFIKKRDGRRVKFDKTKIQKAVESAFNSVDGELTEYATEKAINIANFIETEVLNNTKEMISVEDIQDMVENGLMSTKRKDVAREYIKYRHDRDLMRSTTDHAILSMLNNQNKQIEEENSNKNPTLVNVQRDYMAGIVNKDIAARYIIPKDLQHLHEVGRLHIHDADFMALAEHNCFSGTTKFITDRGICQFNEFRDGDSVTVVDKDGCLRKATVRNYDKGTLNRITLKAGRREKNILATANHRWILTDGTVTTNLCVGDSLYGVKDSTGIDFETLSDEEVEAFTLGLVVGDGCDHQNRTTIRLCGNKTEYLPLFLRVGYHVVGSCCGSDVFLSRKHAIKQDFINGKGWRFLPANLKSLVFKGYYAADGAKSSNKLSTADERLKLLVEETSGLAGYYISSLTEERRDTNFKKGSLLYSYHFVTSQPQNLLWKVVKIRKAYHTNALLWCVEEPITHSFTLDGGVITGNCDLVNLEDMLQNGTVLNGIMIEKPHTLLTATTIASQISLNVSAVQFGGQTMSLEHLAPFVNESRKRYIQKYIELGFDEETVKKLVDIDLKKEIRDSVQTFNYQVNSTISGQGQSPFISLWMYLGDAKTEQERDDLALLIEEVLRQRIQGMKNAEGVYITYAFPKLILCLDKYIMDENSKYHYLKKLAAECTSKRLVPDYISEKVMAENKVNQWGHGDVFPPMGCRSQLSPDFINGNPANALNYKAGVGKYFGRFNHGVTTVNLLWCALEAKNEAITEQDVNKLFYQKVREIMEEARRVQKLRAERLAKTKAKVAPVLWQYGALARLQPEETLDKLVYGSYSTSSFGYNGLYETTKCLTGKDFWKDDETYQLAKDILQFLNDLCEEFKKEDNIAYSLYGTPGESLNGKFGLCIKEHFGEDVFKELDGHDREYLTNSCHIPVWEHIDAFSKLGCEADLQKLSLGGNIVYCESVDMSKNLEAVETVMDFIYDTNIYAEINCETSYCEKCGSFNTIHLTGEMGNYTPTCSHCGNSDRSKMNYAVRVCGYISTNAFTQQRAGDINDRYKHLDNKVME